MSSQPHGRPGTVDTGSGGAAAGVVGDGPGVRLLDQILGQRRVVRAHRWARDRLVVEAEIPRPRQPAPAPFVLGYRHGGSAGPPAAWALDHAHSGATSAVVLDPERYLFLSTRRPDGRADITGRSIWLHGSAAGTTEHLFGAARGVASFAASRPVAVAVIWADPRADSLGDDHARYESWRASGESLALPSRNLWPYLGHRGDGATLRLAAVPLDDAGPARLLSVPLPPDVELTGEVAVTPDGRWCAAGLVEYRRGGHRRFGLYTFAVHRASDGRFVWAADDLSAPVASPDGRWFACTAEVVASPGLAPHQSATFVSFDGADVLPAPAVHDDWLAPQAWDGPDGVLCLGELDGRRRLWRVSRAADEVTPVELPGSVQAVTSDGVEALVVRSSISEPPEVVSIPLRPSWAGAPQPVLASPSRSLTADGGLERRVFRAEDGSEWRSWLCLPRQTDDEPKPVLVWCHGGPLRSWTDWSWRWNPWPFVAEGYPVLMIDPPLSLGYGRRAVARGWGRWLTTVADVAARQVRDTVESDPRLDENRLAVMGASFGGWLSFALASLIPQVRLVVSHAGWVDLAGVARTCDLHWHWLREYGSPGSSQAYPQETVRLAQLSPDITVLLSHGLKDAHVPALEAFGIHRTLDGMGRDVRLMVLPDEGHSIRRIANARAWFRWVLASCAERLEVDVAGQRAVR